MWNRGVIEGRYFSSSDINKSARVALIGTRLVDTLFNDSDPIGEEILIASIPFKIIGILEASGIDPHGEDRDEDVFIPISTAMSRLVKVDFVGTAKVLVANHELVDEDADQIAGILRQTHRIEDGEKEDFYIYTSKFAGRSISEANQVLVIYLLIAAGVVLVVAAAVISSIMLVVVRERISEIGLRKAVGATQQDIVVQFLLEAIGITVISGVLGVVLGVLVANILSPYIDVPVVMSNPIIAMGMLSAILVGIASGIVPALRAAELDPVESLR